MAYATIDDMISAYGEAELVQRTNLDNPVATLIEESVLELALEDATAEINGYLGAYSLPLASIPPY